MRNLLNVLRKIIQKGLVLNLGPLPARACKCFRNNSFVCTVGNTQPTKPTTLFSLWKKFNFATNQGGFIRCLQYSQLHNFFLVHTFLGVAFTVVRNGVTLAVQQTQCAECIVTAAVLFVHSIGDSEPCRRAQPTGEPARTRAVPTAATTAHSKQLAAGGANHPPQPQGTAKRNVPHTPFFVCPMLTPWAACLVYALPCLCYLPTIHCKQVEVPPNHKFCKTTLSFTILNVLNPLGLGVEKLFRGNYY